MRLPQPQHFITVGIPVINPCQSITAPEMLQFMNEIVISNPGPQEKRKRFQKFCRIKLIRPPRNYLPPDIQQSAPDDRTEKP